MIPKKILIIIFIVFVVSCKKEMPKETKSSPNGILNFTKVDKSHSKIAFANDIYEEPRLNYFNFPYMYSGAGVAVGDINNDGLQDIYFVGNMVSNALYLNKGDFVFENITKEAGVSANEPNNLRWSNGVSMADVNNDGWLDIYISASGPFKTRRNLLYINNGDLTFTEKAEEFGLDDNGYSTQSAFFDYDRDGDLDVYICAYAPTALEATNDYYVDKLKNPLEEEKDRLYRNDGSNHFTDVTEEAGIVNFGLSLNLSVADYNNDGWFDIYVSNDFNSPDFFYMNNGDGTFSNQLNSAVNHTANFGMGTDAADINNDGFVDLIQLDMKSDNNKETKTNMSAMAPELFHDAVKKGLHYQYMKNNLQLNNGNGTFSEIAELSGVASTNWSWSALFCDLNNDGWKDLFVSNGIRRNVNHNDFNNYDKLLQKKGVITAENRHMLISKMPVQRHDNFAFVNNGDLTFASKKGNWGLSHVGFTQGTAYADLDNDGDLDIVTSNLDEQAGIYKNNATDSLENSNYLKVKLVGVKDNHFGIGAKLKLHDKGATLYQEMIPTRGYLSSVEPMVHFGVGNAKKIDSLEVIWPNGNVQVLSGIKANSTVEVIQGTDGKPNLALEENTIESIPIFKDITQISKIDFLHQENNFDDYQREILLPHMMSQYGPAIAVGDINGDGYEDIFVGGAKGFSSQFFEQQPDATFIAKSSKALIKDKFHEDVSASLFDADADGDLDLYVVSGGNEEPSESEYYRDRLYINNNNGTFKRSPESLPDFVISGAKVKPADYDNDGDLDLFIGGRQIPGKYPYPSSSYLLKNDSNNGQAVFTDVTSKEAAFLNNLGMVTDISWTDFNKDGLLDLVVVGEWMTVKLFENKKDHFEDVTEAYGIAEQVGWWNSVICADIDNDGDQDIIAGNLGLNYKYKASPEEPFEVFSRDFDDNGKNDIVLGYHEEGNLFPLRGRQCSSDQIPSIKKKFPNYEAFSTATLVDVLGEQSIKNALHYQVTTFASTYFKNNNGTFEPTPLDMQVQISSINTFCIEDVDNDGDLDVIVGGNLYESEVETPRNDSSYGAYLENDGTGKLSYVSPIKAGINLRGETREILTITLANGKKGIIAARNEEKLCLYQIN